MNSRDFCYWLQGYFELADSPALTHHQAVVIKRHLNMVFKHEIDPSHGDKDHQKVLSQVHQGLDKSSIPGNVLSELTKDNQILINC